ncbi:GNAT family N-acetyltransferase [Shigella flexneri]
MRNSDCAAKALIDRQSGELIGICTFTAYSLERQRVSGVLQGSQPSEIGVVRLVMLGRARKYQKRGFGQDLLCDFFEHVKKIHPALPIKGVYLDADPAAINFYARLGFVQLSATPNAFGAVPMFLAIQHILAA